MSPISPILDSFYFLQLSPQQMKWYVDYEPLFVESARAHNVPVQLLLRVAWKESKFNPNAISLNRVPSDGVAQGIMQIIPKFHPGVNPLDPFRAVPYAATWLRSLYDEFGSWRYAVAAYNWGPVNVRGGSYKNAAGDTVTVPPWNGRRESTRDETRRSLDVILGEGWPEPVEESNVFSVGPGVAAKMAEYKSEPASDEIYIGDSLAFAFDQHGRQYVYVKSLNETFVYEPDNMIESWSPKDRRGQLAIRTGVAPYGKRSIGGIDSIDVHYTASPPTLTVEAIARYQTGPNAQESFPSIAYHLVVDNVGTVHWCHDLATRVWHNGASGRNERAIGLCWVGDTVPNERQLDGLKRAVRWCVDQLGRELSVQGHRDSYSTQCPGNRYKEWISQL